MDELLRRLEEARKKHEETSKRINIGQAVYIRPLVFQQILEWSVGSHLTINKSPLRDDGWYHHRITYEGTDYTTRTRKRLFLPDLM